MSAQYAKLTSKGQVTIPVHIRNNLHLASGQRLQFFLTDDSFIVVPISRSIKSLRGSLSPPLKSLTVDEMNEVIRGKYDRG
jgi:antitoxin PrlF